MNSVLFQVVSGLLAIVILMSWFKPRMFEFLLDKDTNIPSLGRIGQFDALVVSSWAFVAMVLVDKLSETYFEFFMATWSGAQALSIFLKIKGAATPPAPSVTTQTTSTTTATGITP